MRPDIQYSVHDLRKLKGARCLTQIHVKSALEAAAATAAGIDLICTSYDTPEAQARFPSVVEAAPRKFISGSTPHGMASEEEAIRCGFRALEQGASSVYCSSSPRIIEAMAREGIPVVGHVGLVPRHVTWTNFRAIGKSRDEALELYRSLKTLENAGAYAAEIEVVPENLATELCRRTSLILMSLGSGRGCDTQYLFSDDILRDYGDWIPRHARSYRDFTKEYARLQDERVAAFREYREEVESGAFPAESHLVRMDAGVLEEVLAELDG